MVPVIALVGRPNVGKSTLFNRMTRTQDALVANFPGLTRDRQYGEATHGGRRMIVIDTAGITGEEEGIDAAMAQQSLQAVQEADAVLFMLDARAGLTGSDRELAQALRQRNKPVFVVANKIDGADPDAVMAELYELGADRIYPITATHGRGVKSLFDAVLELFPVPEAETVAAEEAESGIRLAIVGRPNVGKSTLVNRMLGEERVIVFDLPGTTRDSVYIPYEREGRRYTIIDTAGIRRRRSVSEVIEKFSIVKTLKAVGDAHVVILVLDAREGLVEQDLHLLGHIIEAGRAVVVAVNKWDGLDADHKQHIKNELERRLQFVDYAEIHFISALHGTGVGHLYQSVHAAYAAATQKLQTNRLTRILEDAVQVHAPPLVNGRRIKLRYAHSGGMNPPLVVIHGNQTERVPASYKRYLENIFRRELNLVGTPVRIEFRTAENPYADRRNKLTPRQVERKRRLLKHVKKGRK